MQTKSDNVLEILNHILSQQAEILSKISAIQARWEDFQERLLRHNHVLFGDGDGLVAQVAGLIEHRKLIRWVIGIIIIPLTAACVAATSAYLLK